MTIDRLTLMLRQLPSKPADDRKRGPRPGKAVSVTVQLPPEEVKKRKAKYERERQKLIKEGATPLQQQARREHQALVRQKQGRPRLGRPPEWARD